MHETSCTSSANSQRIKNSWQWGVLFIICTLIKHLSGGIVGIPLKKKKKYCNKF